MKKEYTCACGKIFYNSQSFNGHKSQCKVHHQEKYSCLDNYIDANNRRGKNSGRTLHKNAIERKEIRIKEWLSKEYRCEKCGKVMTEYYGSGRFCSQSCANARQHSEKTKRKIQHSVKLNPAGWASKEWKRKHKKVKLICYCELCGNTLSSRNISGYCKNCYTKNPKYKSGGLRKGAGIGKKGWYKGIYCYSTYELVYVIYNIDHNIEFKPCKKVYKYLWEGKIHRYHPDFELPDGTIIEIKGYSNAQTEAKLKAVKDRPVKVLYKKDLKYAFDYVSKNYQYDKLEDLYEH